MLDAQGVGRRQVLGVVRIFCKRFLALSILHSPLPPIRFRATQKGGPFFAPAPPQPDFGHDRRLGFVRFATHRTRFQGWLLLPCPQSRQWSADGVSQGWRFPGLRQAFAGSRRARRHPAPLPPRRRRAAKPSLQAPRNQNGSRHFVVAHRHFVVPQQVPCTKGKQMRCLSE